MPVHVVPIFFGEFRISENIPPLACLPLLLNNDAARPSPPRPLHLTRTRPPPARAAPPPPAAAASLPRERPAGRLVFIGCKVLARVGHVALRRE